MLKSILITETVLKARLHGRILTCKSKSNQISERHRRELVQGLEVSFPKKFGKLGCLRQHFVRFEGKFLIRNNKAKTESKKVNNSGLIICKFKTKVFRNHANLQMADLQPKGAFL